MEMIHRVCAGLDIHKKTIAACVRVLSEGPRVKQQVRTFGTMTHEIEQLRVWLQEFGVSKVAMESTGVFWKPIWNLLDGHFELMLINPRHIKKVPGRKTDVKDCEWICQLLQYGLLQGSFVPSQQIRQLRDLTRSRAKGIQHVATVVNRIHKVLQDANVKLSSVASDIMGVSGRAMLRAMVEGESDPDQLAAMARGRLKAKIPELRLACNGAVNEHHRFLLHRYLTQVDFFEAEIALFDERILEATTPFHDLIDLLVTIDGIERRTAECLLAELGPDMSQFPSDRALACWSGICPGNYESAGKRLSGKTSKGSRWLHRTLGEAAWAASRTKNTYLSAKYKRLCSRRGKKRAIVAVGHSILTAAYHVLKDRVVYRDLGPDHFDNLNKPRLTRYLVRRLENLGHHVTLAPAVSSSRLANTSS
jgi:transposase